MSKPRTDPHVIALVALTARIEQLEIRLAHAKLARDAEKIESIAKKLALARMRAARLERKRRT